MKEIKKINLLSVAKIFGILGLVNGILVIILMQFTGNVDGVSLNLLDSLLLIVLQGVTWLVGAVVIAFLYNVLTKWIGGVKIDI